MISIENFDIGNVDYFFLGIFKVLTTIEINKCANAPTTAKKMKNLPTNLLNLETISADGTNI